MKCIQVVDDNNMIASVMLVRYREVGNRSKGGWVESYGEDCGSVWIKDMPTKGIVDNTVLHGENIVFECVGTKTYKTGGGSNTVFVLTPISLVDVWP